MNILKINDTGNFILNYKFNFTLINKNCPDDICILESSKKLKVKCIEPFGFSKEIKSSLYSINGQTKIKSYPREKVNPSYNENDFFEFGNEIMKYSKYKRFKDNYEIIEEIGEGSFSKVYLVKNILDNKLYAAKKIDKDNILEDNKNISMEFWEKNIFAYVKNVPHENIVKSIEYFENSEYIYFIFDYLPDGHLIKNDKDTINGIYNGLLYLYKNGIIHRDIKAKNIIMKNGIPIIIDFGLSKMLSKNNLCYESYGTLEYIAPEILEGRGYNHKCDVWSLGIMLHALKYGKVPFKANNDEECDENNKEEIAEQILGKEYIKEENSNYDDLIEICLEKRNVDRKKITQIKRWINCIS